MSLFRHSLAQTHSTTALPSFCDSGATFQVVITTFDGRVKINVNDMTNQQPSTGDL